MSVHLCVCVSARWRTLIKRSAFQFKMSRSRSPPRSLLRTMLGFFRLTELTDRASLRSTSGNHPATSAGRNIPDARLQSNAEDLPQTEQSTCFIPEHPRRFTLEEHSSCFIFAELPSWSIPAERFTRELPRCFVREHPRFFSLPARDPKDPDASSLRKHPDCFTPMQRPRCFRPRCVTRKRCRSCFKEVAAAGCVI